MSLAIDVSHLTKTYGRVVAVENLSLQVPAGSVFGFLGPNGAGKSTTFACLTGLTDPTAGDIRLFGERLADRPEPIKRRLGVMPEGLGLFEALSAREFVEFHGGVYGLDRLQSSLRTAELLDALGLGDQGRKPLAEFSAGMRKRVAFAAALVHRPEILFLDEPFESVDPAGVAMMKQWLRDIAAQGRTVFLASHALETVERLCDRVAIVKAPGHVVWQGDITGFAQSRRVEVAGRGYTTLEDLYLDVSGRQTAAMAWL